MRELENTKINNNIIFSLFASKEKKSNDTVRKDQLLTEIFEVLYTFCLSKATLKSLSRDIFGGLHKLFGELDEHSRGFVDTTDMRLILSASKVDFKEKDLKLLMSHLGDG